MPKLGVNIDHVATVRQARRAMEPDPCEAAAICEKAGCDSIVVHLRQDRRHINDGDLKKLKAFVKVRLNLEMSCADEIVGIACKIKPDQATLVPEKRQELTTEGGLDVVKNRPKVGGVIKRLKNEGILASLFIDPEEGQIALAKELGADSIELHTGEYANSISKKEKDARLERLIECALFGKKIGLIVNAGHGLTYANTKPVAQINGIEELNIGHSIISRAVLIGLDRAVREMLEIVK